MKVPKNPLQGWKSYIFEMSFFKNFEIGLEIGLRVPLNCFNDIFSNFEFLAFQNINSLALMTFEKVFILKVVRMGAMNLALRPSARCINI